ncbi:MAG: calcium/sodium antiporter [Flavobacteriales bacterium]|nr:calcium/sodium antiporter [Flavobacteriales bacterium]
MWLGWVQLIAGLVFLIIAGEFLVRSSVRLALYLKISSLVIGLTVVSFGTSFPELVVSLNAAIGGHPDISIGNVVGSNIANLALVMGVSAIFFTMTVDRSSVVIDWPLMLLSSILLIVFAWDLKLELWEGAIMVTGLLAFNIWVIRESRRENKSQSTDEDFQPASSNIIRTLLVFGASMIGLIVGADIMVDGAVSIARGMNIEERVIAITVIAFGTSVPELATSLIALYKKEVSISVGNLIGSNIFNILGILGVTAVIQPIDVNPEIKFNDFYWFLGIPLLLYPVLITRLKVSRIEGILLFGTYILYIYLVI